VQSDTLYNDALKQLLQAAMSMLTLKECLPAVARLSVDRAAPHVAHSMGAV
jgi:hypothetical protein